MVSLCVRFSNGGATCGQYYPVQQSGQCHPVLQTRHQDGIALPDTLHRSAKCHPTGLCSEHLERTNNYSVIDQSGDNFIIKSVKMSRTFPPQFPLAHGDVFVLLVQYGIYNDMIHRGSRSSDWRVRD